MASEQTVGVVNQPSGTKQVRTNQVTEPIAGVLTTVDQQVVGLSDSVGVVFDSLLDREERRMMEMNNIATDDAMRGSFVRRQNERISLTDRRGNNFRGTTR